jgi:hypothetical protein
MSTIPLVPHISYCHLELVLSHIYPLAIVNDVIALAKYMTSTILTQT